MAISKGMAKSKRKALAKWFPTIANAIQELAQGTRTEACLETVEILMDIDQVTSLFASLDEARRGHVLHMDSAFGDL